MKKVGFIGTGNIARALVSGIKHSGGSVSNIYISGKDNEVWEKSKEKFAQDFGVTCTANNKELVEKCDFIVLALEPKVYPFVISEIKDVVKLNQVFISLAPNFSIKEIAELLGDKGRIVRVIPNVFATVSRAMSGMAFQYNRFSEIDKQAVISFFEQFSKVEVIAEKFIDMIPAMSGSAPAYMYMILEAMADAGALIGFPRKLAYTFASQAMIGAGTMVQETGLHPCELKDTVCTPGGTTVEALKVFEKQNLKGIIVEGMLACYDKSHKLK